MTGNYKYIAVGLLFSLLITACSKDGADGNDVSKPNEGKKEIGFKADIWKMVEATRATTYDNVASLQTEAHFTCVAYEADSDPLVSYISTTTTVDWVSGDNRWEFNGGASHYYWPLPATNGGAWPSLDFFGYMPSAANLSTEAPYIAADPAITYYANHNVTFTCSDLPMTNTEQGSSLKEFVFGMALGQNYGNASTGVPLQFQHPFARIKLQLAASHPNVTIHSITFRSIKNNGSYDHSATPKWSTSGDATDFVLTLTGAAAVFDDNSAAKPIGEDYIMIPQDWTGVIVVNADCLYWGDKVNYPSLTTTVPTDWESGHSYTYTFNISPDDLKVNIAKFTEQW